MKYECKAFYTFWAAVNISVVNFIGLIRVIEGTFFFFFPLQFRQWLTFCLFPISVAGNQCPFLIVAQGIISIISL